MCIVELSPLGWTDLRAYPTLLPRACEETGPELESLVATKLSGEVGVSPRRGEQGFLPFEK